MYDKNGKLKGEWNYQNGNPNGLCKIYHENGNLSIVGKYKNGTKVGVWTYYNEDGEIIQKENYSKPKEEIDQTDDDYEEDEETEEDDDDFDLMENDIIDGD